MVWMALENVNILPMVTNFSDLRASSLPLWPQVSDRGRVSFNKEGQQDQKHVDEYIRQYFTPTLPPPPPGGLDISDNLSEPENIANPNDEIGFNISNDSDKYEWDYHGVNPTLTEQPQVEQHGVPCMHPDHRHDQDQVTAGNDQHNAALDPSVTDRINHSAPHNYGFGRPNNSAPGGSAPTPYDGEDSQCFSSSKSQIISYKSIEQIYSQDLFGIHIVILTSLQEN